MTKKSKLMTSTLPHIQLASNSPRRRELLGLLTDDFEIAPGRDIDETYPADLAPEDVPAYLSRLKSAAYADMKQQGRVIITADTVVINGGKILGKPHSRAQAIEMLRSLAGHEHTVVTGVTVAGPDRSITFSEKTEVEFGPLTDEEIESYVDRYEPYDKAGAYGIQEWIGAAGIKGIRGCFYNVMGLPLHALHQHLKQL